MKKLLITSMAAASMALMADTDPGRISGTDFTGFGLNQPLIHENLEQGSDQHTESQFWANYANSILTVTNFNYGVDNAEENPGLLLDTDGRVTRNIKSDGSATNLTSSIFFDSRVQFTAAETAPEVKIDEGDKLIAWLYKSPDDVSETAPGIFGEQTSQTTLVITAGKVVDGALVAHHYPVAVEGIANFAEKTWYRLTIKAIDDIDTSDAVKVGFKVFVNGNPAVATTGEDVFPSLMEVINVSQQVLTGVAFEGTGAVDDLVFTTTAPDFAADAVSADVKITFNDFAAIDTDLGGVWYEVNTSDNSVDINYESTDVTLNVGDKVSVHFFLREGYELVSPNVEPIDGEYVITVDALTADGATFAIVTKVAEVEPEVAKPFTVTIAGVETPFATLAGAIEAANGETIKLTEDATLMEKLTIAQAAVIDLNGQTLTLADAGDDNYAVVVESNLTITDSSEEKSGKVVVLGLYGFGMNAGSLTINAGTFEANGADYLIGAWGGTVAISGGDFTAEYCVVNLFDAAARAEITGGKFTVAEESDGYDCYAILSEKDGKVEVSAGLFSTAVEEAFCAEGYIPTTQADVNGYYTVVAGYAVTVIKADNADVTGLDAKYAVGATVTFTVTAVPNYQVTSVTADNATVSATANAGEYSFTMPAKAVKITVETQSAYVEPSVEPDGDEEITEPLSDDAKAVIKAQFPAGGVVLKVEVNGAALKGDEAVKMINEVVEKFEGNPFTESKLVVDFKVTDVMEVLKGAGAGYTLEVGNAELKAAYKVVPKYIDLATKAESFDAPADTSSAIFKLVIKAKAE